MMNNEVIDKIIRKRDFSRLRKVLLREGEPDVLPLYELMIDYPLLCHISDKPDYVSRTIDFFYSYGFDYIPAWPKIDYPMRVKATRDTAGTTFGDRQYIDERHGAIETRKDFEEYIWPNFDSIVAYPIKVFSEQLPDGMKLMVNMRSVFEHVLFIMGFESLSYALYDDPSLVSDMFERVGSSVFHTIELCLKAVDTRFIGAFTICDDMGHNGGTIISVDDLRKYVFPWHQKYVNLIHSYDIPVILHSCGNLEQVMDDIIDYSKFDAKHSFEDKIMPVTEAKTGYGSRIALLGGVDMNKLCTYEDDQLREYCREIITSCMPGGGYAFGSGNSVANYVDIKKYNILVDECMKSIY